MLGTLIVQYIKKGHDCRQSPRGGFNLKAEGITELGNFSGN